MSSTPEPTTPAKEIVALVRALMLAIMRTPALVARRQLYNMPPRRASGWPL